MRARLGPAGAPAGLRVGRPDGEGWPGLDGRSFLPTRLADALPGPLEAAPEAAEAVATSAERGVEDSEAGLEDALCAEVEPLDVGSVEGTDCAGRAAPPSTGRDMTEVGEAVDASVRKSELRPWLAAVCRPESVVPAAAAMAAAAATAAGPGADAGPIAGVWESCRTAAPMLELELELELELPLGRWPATDDAGAAIAWLDDEVPIEGTASMLETACLCDSAGGAPAWGWTSAGAARPVPAGIMVTSRPLDPTWLEERSPGLAKACPGGAKAAEPPGLPGCQTVDNEDEDGGTC